MKINELKGDYIHTYTGKHFYALDPRPDQICLEDIAHALSNTCRFGGMGNFYSVAQHCVIMSYLVSEENALWGLLHDSSEAYIGDMPKPFKRMMPEYQGIEAGIMKAVCEKFMLDPEEPHEVKSIDSRIVVSEAKLIFKDAPDWTNDNDPIDISDYLTSFWRPDHAKIRFLLRYDELVSGNKSQRYKYLNKLRRGF